MWIVRLQIGPIIATAHNPNLTPVNCEGEVIDSYDLKERFNRLKADDKFDDSTRTSTTDTNIVHTRFVKAKTFLIEEE